MGIPFGTCGHPKIHMNKEYKSLIFTKHALERMSARQITQDAVWRVLQSPDRSLPEDKPQTSRFIRQLNGRTYHVIATYLPDQKKTLIVSAWVRGEDDRVPLMWQLITLPFKLAWWIIRKSARLLFNR
jgi:hypothetical protein